MTRDELIETVTAADERLAALRPRLEAAADQPLLTGTWRVRDALSHLAARANPVPNVLRRIAEQESQTPPPPRPPIDDVNAEQVEVRTGRSVPEILDELQAGHRATIDSLPGDDVLAKMLPAFGGGEVTAAEMIARAGVRHEQNHLNDILAALPS